MKRLKKYAMMAGLMMTAVASQASVVTWDTVRTEGMQYASFTLDSVKYTANAGAIVGNISGWGSQDGEYYAFCTDPLGAYVPHFEGTTSLIQGDLSTFFSYVYYGIRGVDDYASAQLAVWEIVTDVAQGFTPDYASGAFISGDTLAESAMELIERGRLLAANSPAVQFYNVNPYEQGNQSFGISMQAQAVPEPATATIVSLGLFGMWSMRRRRVSGAAEMTQACEGKCRPIQVGARDWLPPEISSRISKYMHILIVTGFSFVFFEYKRKR